MAHETINGTYRQTNLSNESAEYLLKREDLRQAEIELMRQRERVAELRRALPEGATIENYEFLEGPTALDDGDESIVTVRMSELFTASNRSLVIYHFMFGKEQTRPCPMCTSWIDSFNGVAHHLAQNVDLAIVAAAEPARLRAHARTRGWDKLRLLSAAQNTFKYDLGSEDRTGHQDSTISVFTRASDGALRHFYSVHPRLADDIEERGIDEYNPIWNVLDLTRQGRGSWDASLDYGTKVQAHHLAVRGTDVAPWDGFEVRKLTSGKARWSSTISIAMHNLLIDLDREIASTRRLLERYPLGKGEWQPHDKSRTLSALATHVATIPNHGAYILTTEEMDVASRQPQPPKDSAAELLEAFDTGVARLKSAVADIDEAKLSENWTMRIGPRVLVSEPRRLLMRLMVINHLVHHRAQLGMYLRLLDVPIPGMYGPSADEPA